MVDQKDIDAARDNIYSRVLALKANYLPSIYSGIFLY